MIPVEHRPDRVKDPGGVVSASEPHRPVGHGHQGVDHTRRRAQVVGMNPPRVIHLFIARTSAAR